METNKNKMPEQPTWEGFKKYFATEVIEQSKRNAKRWFVAWVVTLATLLSALIATNTYWIYVFNSYEYVTQDGEGYNYYNSEIDGDVSNGSEN